MVEHLPNISKALDPFALPKGRQLGSKKKGLLLNSSLTFLFCFPRHCGSGCPGTHYCIDQADLGLRDPPTSASLLLGLKAHVTTACLPPVLNNCFICSFEFHRVQACSVAKCYLELLTVLPLSSKFWGKNMCTTMPVLCSCWDQPEGLVHARQALYQVSCMFSPQQLFFVCTLYTTCDY